MVAVLAREFHTLPSQVARELDRDPEQLALACLPLLRYADALSVYRSNDKEAIKRYRGRMMARVEQIDFELAQRSLEG